MGAEKRRLKREGKKGGQPAAPDAKTVYINPPVRPFFPQLIDIERPLTPEENQKHIDYMLKRVEALGMKFIIVEE